MFWRIETRTTDEFLAGPHVSEPVWLADLECPQCDGRGEVYAQGIWQECTLCGESGRIYYDPDVPEHAEAYRRKGVSCFRTPEELYCYFQDLGSGAICPDKVREVVVFSGQVVGLGLDDEPLVIPAAKPHPRRISWEKFTVLVKRRLGR